MLAGGTRLVEALHGEVITVLSGVNAGQKFTAVRETQADQILITDLGQDGRAKRVMRFREGGPVPVLAPADKIATDDGKTWTAVRAPQDGYQTTDFELTEVLKKDGAK